MSVVFYAKNGGRSGFPVVLSSLTRPEGKGLPDGALWIKTRDKLSGDVTVSPGDSWPEENSAGRRPEKGDLWLASAPVVGITCRRRANVTANITQRRNRAETGLYCAFVHDGEKWVWRYSELYAGGLWKPVRTAFDSENRWNLMIDTADVTDGKALDYAKFEKSRIYRALQIFRFNGDASSHLPRPYEQETYPVAGAAMSYIAIGKMTAHITYFCLDDIENYSFEYDRGADVNNGWSTSYAVVDFARAGRPPLSPLWVGDSYTDRANEKGIYFPSLGTFAASDGVKRFNSGTVQYDAKVPLTDCKGIKYGAIIYSGYGSVNSKGYTKIKLEKNR